MRFKDPNLTSVVAHEISTKLQTITNMNSLNTSLNILCYAIHIHFTYFNET